MHEMSTFWLRAAVACYAVGLLHALLTAMQQRTRWFVAALGALEVGVVLHLVSIVERWRALGHIPASNFLESASLCGLLVALTFLFVRWKYQFESLSLFLFPLIFFLGLLGSMEDPVGTWGNRDVRGAWLLIHVTLVLFAYAALLLMAVASIFYLIRERQLKTKVATPSRLFDHLPPLGTLDNIINQSMGAGFTLLTLATVAGITWGFIESGTKWMSDAKVAISLATWVLTLVMVFLRTSAGWRGRKAALLSLTVVGCSALTWAAHVGLRPILAN